FRLSAACFDAPSTQAPSSQEQDLNHIPQQQRPQQGNTIQTPGGQDLNVWTPEELAEHRNSRQGNIPGDMDVWTPEELEENAKARKANIPNGMEVWKEEELEELAKKRQGGIDMPEWKPDEEMKECTNCGYSLREGWTECPICGTPVGGKNENTKAPSENKSDNTQIE
ncbi:MAG: zinc-ribbon domain-containing protein, partial [Promethearchaeota archaeon]